MNNYTAVADRLKRNFNRPIKEGGFWSPEKKQYVYWRDQDGSVHGDNLVTPVNFAVIAFGLCDDERRVAQVLRQIERRMEEERLFHWPLCFDSFRREEVSERNWPFPTYENGDIFPTWGYLGVRAYAAYDKGIALKYIWNLLEQYEKDGLSSQRYSRTTQLGQGSDILAGICTGVTALYRDIYGIRPKWNRMGLEPNLSKVLDGTEFTYTLRDTAYLIRLHTDEYMMQTDRFVVRGKEAFGASFREDALVLYPHNRSTHKLIVSGESGQPIDVTLMSCSPRRLDWRMNRSDNYTFVMEGLEPTRAYSCHTSRQNIPVHADKDGKVRFSLRCEKGEVLRLVLRQ